MRFFALTAVLRALAFTLFLTERRLADGLFFPPAFALGTVLLLLLAFLFFADVFAMFLVSFC